MLTDKALVHIINNREKQYKTWVDRKINFKSLRTYYFTYNLLPRDFNARRFFLFLTSLGKLLQEKSKVLTIRTFCAWFSWVVNIGMGWNRSIFVDERVGKLIIRESDWLIVLFIHCMISSVIRLFGLGVWFSLRVREVPGSNPGGAQLFFWRFALQVIPHSQKGKL